MKYLLDTDHLSIIQRQTGQDYVNLSTRMAQYPLSDFAISVVTFHEQLHSRQIVLTNSLNSNFAALAEIRARTNRTGRPAAFSASS